MIIRTAKPARCFLGIQPGHRHFRDLKEGSQIHAVEGVLIYRFSSNLFFANIQVLKQDIEDHVTDQTRAVILDASGIGSMDITAADGLGMLYQSLKEKGIRFYMTEHIADLNEQLRKLGLGYMIEEGSVRRTIHIALKIWESSARIRWRAVWTMTTAVPRESARTTACRNLSGHLARRRRNRLKTDSLQIEQLKEGGDVENLLHGRWSHMEAMDEDEWLEHLEEHLKEIVNISGKDEKTLARRLEEHRREVHDALQQSIRSLRSASRSADMCWMST